ncbi:AIR synthase related protein [Ancylobacter novellus DSM 506]|uniref:AIR synthase related protein n=1 Tax=Ancylobacter novellus (strain ATCC 8093 / DSM 506 / JCM 20403 / CCM 1077 / IAM 12100 / NBRC 12443 / NCIMB 10456) TaxID=639283 RepID=D7AAW9_ANCN5|nr:sll0787 family AIR synthase-like protein [Ancylobacter novellus]ADH90986.1 AIR synthase related protein [Ancylobacter novellus DSM 506]
MGPLSATAFEAIAARLRDSKGMAAKADIGLAVARLGLSGADSVPVGDDCAAIPDGDGFLLFAIEGFMNEFVAGDPWFAGWCGVMVNLSDIAAMGGRPVAVVDAVWAKGEEGAAPVLEGLRAASERFGVPLVGGHTNLKTDRGQLSVAVLGRAKKLLTSFDARPGETLIAAIDLRGRYREPFSNWEAATDAPASRLRGDLEVLPLIAEAGLSRAAKDISQGGIVGTSAMLAECSGVGIEIDLSRVPAPEGVDLARWLMSFPSYGYLLSATPDDVPALLSLFEARGIANAAIGSVTADRRVTVANGAARETIWDFSQRALLGCGPAAAKAEDAA